jgi:ABC-type uncharacterized transport system involved in gliding motility auxiliary subunit
MLSSVKIIGEFFDLLKKRAYSFSHFFKSWLDILSSQREF